MLEALSHPGAVACAMPEFVSPMLATTAKDVPEGPEWQYEVKWDGVRVIAWLRHQHIELRSRRGSTLTEKFPECSELAQCTPATEAIFDGEIVALDNQGRPDFALLQRRLVTVAPARLRQLTRAFPVRYYLFDLLYLDGYDLRRVPLDVRQKTLARLLRCGTFVRLSEPLAGSAAQVTEVARKLGLEGIVAKRRDSAYESGRSHAWLKVKLVRRQDVVICGYTLGKRASFASLVVAVRQGEGLRYAGCVGTGFDTQTATQLREQLDKLRLWQPPIALPADFRRRAVWVRPLLVCSVKFQDWTPQGRLRSPVFLGLRADVDPDECVPEAFEEPEQSPS